MKAIDGSFYRSTSVVLAHVECWENNCKVFKSSASGSWVTNFFCILPTFSSGLNTTLVNRQKLKVWSLSDSFNDSNRCSRESYLPELSDLNSHTRNQTVIILTLFWVHSDHAQAILFLRFISALGYNSHHHVRLLTSFRAPALVFHPSLTKG